MRPYSDCATGTAKTHHRILLVEGYRIQPTRRQRIAAELLAGGMTHAEAAKECGITRSALSRRIMDYRKATADEYVAIVCAVRKRKQIIKPLQLHFSDV
ncbi:MAG: helix-turn-helix domain-containing protein [Phycisphaerae bacterium]|nr:helix-turn-helix domain-containing protein [Phycisphaerae bacterium]